MATEITIIEIANYVADDIGDTTLTTDQLRGLVKKGILRINRRLAVAALDISIVVDDDECMALFPSGYVNSLKDFVIMQTECIIAKRQHMESVSKGIRIRSGSDEVDTTAGFGGQRDVVNSICSELDDAFGKFIETQNQSTVAENAGLIWYGEQRKYEDADHDGQYYERKHPFDSGYDDESAHSL